VSGHLHTQATELRENSLQYPLNRKEAGWAAELVWMFWIREKSCAPSLCGIKVGKINNMNKITYPVFVIPGQSIYYA
jgi:hypothetical protein